MLNSRWRAQWLIRSRRSRRRNMTPKFPSQLFNLSVPIPDFLFILTRLIPLTGLRTLLNLPF
ncbi:hypothetical protein BDZ91DRAFT_731258 [Kalaharituber pfeilii]|nr:hypothetical protein BDZ91DRAFT_731258 [Kalaharituber pfeilii]